MIGIVQELQARRTLNELAVLSAPKARVRRDGDTIEVGISEVVADDILELSPGDQVVVDGDVLAESGLELDESLLTGESDPVEKAVGDAVLSGSFVSAGSGFYRATHIGAESYAAKLSEEARRFELAGSELRRGVNVILRWLTFIIPPASILLLLRQLDTQSEWQDALQATVAAAVAMVPDGLVLLTSLSFIAGVVALARRQALAKELASVELLARVDTLCLDKTGTITTGEISLASIKPVGGTTDAEAAEILGALGASDPSPNATLQAIIAHYRAPRGGRSPATSRSRQPASGRQPSSVIAAPSISARPTSSSTKATSRRRLEPLTPQRPVSASCSSPALTRAGMITNCRRAVHRCASCSSRTPCDPTPRRSLRSSRSRVSS